MKLGKAIEELDYIVDKHKLRAGARSIEAVRLGIEAIKRVQAGRPAPPSLAFLSLPGETEE